MTRAGLLRLCQAKRGVRNMKSHTKISILASIPHNGEQIVEESPWLKGLNEVTLMYDVDRFIAKMYEQALSQNKIPKVLTPYHRYVIDCNRWLTDIDCCSVENSKTPAGSHVRGLYWQKTTAGFPLLKSPISVALHKQIVKKYYDPFFQEINALYSQFQKAGATHIYHLDLHSMPSRGTALHRDPGQERADIVIGNEHGKTASPAWTQQVTKAYQNAGFKVKLNDPYTGGTIVEKYGKPQQNKQALMIELNRNLYMDEKTKQIVPAKAEPIKQKLNQVISEICHILSQQ